MSDYTPEEREFISMARAGQSPTAQDRNRVLQLIVATPLVAGTSEAVAGTSKLTGLAAGWKQLVVGALMLGGAGTGAYYALSPSAPEPAPVQVTSPVVVTVEPKSEETVEQEIPREAEEVAPVIEQPPAPKAKLRPREPADQLAADVALLRKAQLAMKSGDAASALQHVAEHTKSFPRSALGSERNVLRIRALCALGRVEQAKQQAERLLSGSANSPLHAALKNSCVSSQ